MLKSSDEERFIRAVEGMIEPMDVSHLLFLQELRRLLPTPLFKRMLRRASRSTPYLGFVIEPYSLFLFFRLSDVDRARSMLPARYELAEARIFADDTPGYYFGVGNLNTRATTFWGARQESYLIARDRETGLLSWIFIGILSNTVIAVPTTGVAAPNSRRAMFTTNSKGEVLVDFAEDRTGRRLALTGSITNGTRRALDEPLWLLGNTSVAHSTELAGGYYDPFAVIFDPAEVEYALDIPTRDMTIRENTLFPGLAEPELTKVICFPYAQHYIADSPWCRTVVGDRAELMEKYTTLSRKDRHKTFSSRTIKIEIAVGTAVLLAIVAILVVAL